MLVLIVGPNAIVLLRYGSVRGVDRNLDGNGAQGFFSFLLSPVSWSPDSVVLVPVPRDHATLESLCDSTKQTKLAEHPLVTLRGGRGGIWEWQEGNGQPVALSNEDLLLGKRKKKGPRSIKPNFLENALGFETAPSGVWTSPVTRNPGNLF